MLGVEAHSFLPDQQGDGRHLARQSQTRHLRPDSFGYQRIVKLLERTRLGSGHGGSTLEYILQLVIVIAIQPTNRSRLFARCSSPCTNLCSALLCVSIPNPL